MSGSNTNARTSADTNAENPEAILFVSNLTTDSNLSSQWSKLIDQVNSAVKGASDKDKAYKEAISAIDNFLAAQSYNATAEEVLSLIKSPFYQDHIKESEPNNESDRFVQALMTDAKIYKSWQSLVLKAGSGEVNFNALDEYLANNGYKCTYKQINASFFKMRNHNISYWSGAYTTRKISTSQLRDEEGPNIVIYGKNIVSIDSDMLMRVANKVLYTNGTLSWDKDILGKSSGKITFSEIMPNLKQPTTYAGPILSGKITNFDSFGSKDGTVYSIYGQLTQKVTNESKLPIRVKPKEIDKIYQWLKYLINGLMIVQVIVSVAKKYSNAKGAKAAEKGFSDRMDKSIAEGKASEASLSSELSSPMEDIDFAGSDVLKDIQEKLDAAKNREDQNLIDKYSKEYSEQKTSEDEFDNEPIKESEVEGEGWGKGLQDILRDVV